MPRDLIQFQCLDMGEGVRVNKAGEPALRQRGYLCIYDYIRPAQLTNRSLSLLDFQCLGANKAP